MQKKYICLICSIVCIFITGIVQIKGEEIATVRVVVEDSSRYSTTTKTGKPTGYMYEYLKEIQKYTGWKYEFVQGEPTKLGEWLESGKVDIVGAMLGSPEIRDKYLMTSASVGSNYITLISNKDSKKSVYNFSKVGAMKKNIRGISEFKEYCKKNQLNIELVIYENLDDFKQALDKGEVDGIIGNDFNVEVDQKIVEKIAERPYYIGVTGKKPELLEVLNEAIAYIELNKPDFKDQLYVKYYSNEDSDQFKLSEEEMEYIRELQKVVVGYIEESAPYSYYDSKKNQVRGIGVQILEEIGKDIGLEFEYIGFKNIKEAIYGLKKGLCKMLITNIEIGLLEDRGEYYATNSYLSAQLEQVTHKNSVKGAQFISPQAAQGIDIESNKIEGDMESVLNHISENPNMYTIADTYTLKKQSSNKVFPNIVITPIREEARQEFLIAQGERELLQIMNKKINDFAEEKKDEIIYEYMKDQSKKKNLDEFIYTYMTEIGLLVGCFICGIIGVGMIIFRMRVKYHRQVNDLLRESAEKDGLTGLFNRKTCEEMILEFLKQKESKEESAFVLIDIDYFKQVNDTLGHMIGDQVLRDIAMEIDKLFKEDIVGRWGGDEFIIFIKKYDEKSLEKIKQLNARMHRKVYDDKHENSVMISGSIGITGKLEENKDEIHTIRKYYEEADQTLYEVKKQGRNGYRVFDRGMSIS